MLYVFELDHNDMKTTKNICCANDEFAANHSTVTRWFKKFCSGCKNVNNQAGSGRPKSMDSKATLETLAANRVSSALRVSGELKIS